MTDKDLAAGAEIIELHDRSAAELAIEAFGRLATSHKGAYGAFIAGVHRLLTEQDGSHQNPVPFGERHLAGFADRPIQDLYRQVERYNREESIHFCETEFYVQITKYGRGERFAAQVVPVDEVLHPFGHFKPPTHIKYRRDEVKSKKLRTMDGLQIIGRIYVFVCLLILDVAATVILASSARLVSYSLLWPAVYTIYLIYREASFVVNRIRLIRSVYSPKVRVKTLVYNEDKTMLKVSKFRVTAHCPICRGNINLSQGASVYNGQIVGRCEAAFLSHVFSFDPTTNTGHFLN